MKKINLRELFPEYTLDCFIEVPDENYEAYLASLTKDVADVFVAATKDENAYLRRLYRGKAYYSLDRGDGIENEMLPHCVDPCELFENKWRMTQLYAAINSLPEKQARRIYAHFFLGMSKAEIARAEGVAENAVKDSIRYAIRSIKKYL